MNKFWMEFDTDADDETLDYLAEKIHELLQEEITVNYEIKNLILNGETYKKI